MKQLHFASYMVLTLVNKKIGQKHQLTSEFNRAGLVHCFLHRPITKKTIININVAFNEIVVGAKKKIEESFFCMKSKSHVVIQKNYQDLCMNIYVRR